VVEEVRKRQKNLGPDAVRFAWVKAHVGTQGNEKADQMAKFKVCWTWADRRNKTMLLLVATPQMN